MTKRVCLLTVGALWFLLLSIGGLALGNEVGYQSKAWVGWLSGFEGHEEALQQFQETQSTFAVYLYLEDSIDCQEFERSILQAPEVVTYLQDKMKVRLNRGGTEAEQSAADEYQFVQTVPAFLVVSSFGELPGSSKFKEPVQTTGTPAQFIEACQQADLKSSSVTELSKEQPGRTGQNFLSAFTPFKGVADKIQSGDIKGALPLILLLALVICLAPYLYYSICLQTIARKTETPRAWMAWLPPLSLYLWVKIARLSGLWILLVVVLGLMVGESHVMKLLLPVVAFVDFRIFKIRKKPIWMLFVMYAGFVPELFGFTVPFNWLGYPIGLGYLAFSK